MRLHRLELTGFGPFRTHQVVDFDAFAADGIFLIAGRTGAGKSSILDGVCFALYGGVPRYVSGERRLRSDHCETDDPTEVSLEFTAAGRRLRVTRSPDHLRPKRRGDGVTPEPHRAMLEERVDGVWVALAARPVDVGRELHEIVGLTQEQFLQVVLLAQNRFAEFLHAPNDKRRAVLQTLFETRRYEDYAVALDERRKSAEADLAARVVGVRRSVDEILRADDVIPAGDDLDAALEAASLVVARAGYRVDTTTVARDAADAAFRAAEAEHRAATGLAERLAARDASRAALAARESADAEVAADRVRLAVALDAEELRGALTDADRAQVASDEARRAEAQARRALHEPADADDPTALVDALAGTLAVSRAALERETEVARLDDERSALARRLEAQTAAETELVAQLAAIPVRLAELDGRLASDRLLAGGATGSREAVAALEARLAAAQEARRLGPLRDAAEAALADALEESGSAVSALTALLRRRLAGHAGELATRLVDGEPCLVCGSTSHPAPAAPSDDGVSDDDLATAEARRDRAAAAETVAATAAREARDAVARVAAHAGGAGVDDLDRQLVEARRVRDEAIAAATRVAADEGERALLLTLEGELEVERSAVARSIADDREAMARCDERREAAVAAVAAARGPHASVAARIRVDEQRRVAARTFADALAAAARCAAAAAAAAAALDALVETSPLDGVAAVRDALLDRNGRARIAERVAEHETAVRVERERLLALELELADASESSVDLDGAAARRQAARDAWTAAIGDATRAAQDAARLVAVLDRASAAHAEIAGHAREAAAIARLAHTLAGRAPNTHRMDLETFVLAAELEEIVGAANLRLGEMSAGRFRLAHTDALAARGAASGLGLEVVDAFTGRARPTASLSGGETFLASLALALGLAEVVTARAGGTRLDTLFVDEGFGHLDGETLELALQTLDELRQGGRTVGVISHVESMKERLAAQLRVEALPGGPSVIHQDIRVSAV